MSNFLLWYRHVPAGTPLTRVGGMSLVHRAVATAQAAGHEQVAIAVQSEDLAAVRQHLDDQRRLAVQILVVDSAAQLRASAEGSQDTVFALGDRVFLRDVLRALQPDLEAGQDAVRVTDEDGRDAGVLRLRAQHWPDAMAGDDIDPEQLPQLSAHERAIPHAWHVIRSADDRAPAERMLLRSLIKPTDGVVSRNINRKISTTITRRLARYNVLPNHVTAVVLLIGLAATPLAWQGSYLGFALGGLCYYVSAILDGVDGELSRLKFLGSPLGAWLDTITDDVVGLAWLVGMYAGLVRTADETLWLWFGAISISGYVLTILLRYYVLITRVGSGDHQKLAPTSVSANTGFNRVVDFLRDIFFRTDFLPFFAAVTACIGQVQVFAAVYALGAMMALAETAIGLPKAGR